MFSLSNCLLLCGILLLYSSKTCTGDIPSPTLVLYMAGEPEYTDVLVRRVHDNLTLICELRGDVTPRLYVWNYVRENHTSPDIMFKVDPKGPTSSSTLTKQDLQESDSGQYMCSAPPFSVTKYILVQTKGPKYCGRGAFWCGQRCMAPQYVCDGRRDCEHAEDEAPHMCPAQVCARSDKLNCSTGRCISEAACCRGPRALCQQPSCCDEHPRYSRQEGYVDVEYPPLFEDRHADDYGFIQSTIYTVTACALIFMIAVVLLVSAICKMHMKRAALRSYAHAERATRHHYSLQYAQTQRYPPCYETSRLLEAAAPPASPQHDPLPSAGTTHHSPVESPAPAAGGLEEGAAASPGFGLARLSAIFSSRYRQVPTQSDVELTNVRSTSLNNSPTRNRTLDNYRSPTYCDLNTSEFYFTNPETGDFARDLNYMATPVDYMRRNSNNTLDRVIDQLDRQRLTLQLGRFQLTIPRFGRRAENDRRPDTPNIAEINIDDLDFVRMTSHDTYTLNGRTIRLLGANFENYPVLPDGTRPPPYNEAMRCKFFGPPPEYLSREGLNSRVDEEARNNVEMPPGYDELASGGDNGNTAANNVAQSAINTASASCSGNNNIVTINSDATTSEINDIASVRDRSIASAINNTNNNEIVTSNGTNNVSINNNNTSATQIISPVITPVINGVENNDNNNVQSISSVINNLPAIDSDINANDTAINC